eukprot:TRINITY_DN21286_c0_g1_i2.p1 TRINITY_DN21286_c0_g1~~TRINITY_DN21286_c0_g1_i2.p1  ORF type:complete len:278 (-),score=77.15 TRINITY_DN21286_c0_g1_i2:163-996(-)
MLEERAAQRLRGAPEEVQRMVLGRGTLSGTRNPSAVLISRVRNAEDGLKPVTVPASDDVERFLKVENVEPHAAARLRRSTPIVQKLVIARGTLSGTRDPSAVLMTRIRDAEKEAGPAASDGSSGGGANGLSADPLENADPLESAAYMQQLAAYQYYQQQLLLQAQQEQQALEPGIADLGSASASASAALLPQAQSVLPSFAASPLVPQLGQNLFQPGLTGAALLGADQAATALPGFPQQYPLAFGAGGGLAPMFGAQAPMGLATANFAALPMNPGNF